MNTEPELNSLSDQQLSELVAVEVAGWQRNAKGWWVRPDGHLVTAGEDRLLAEPEFASSADAVLPLFKKLPAGWLADFSHNSEHGWKGYIFIHYINLTPCGLGNSQSFARAAALALLGAARASKEATP